MIAASGAITGLGLLRVCLIGLALLALCRSAPGLRRELVLLVRVFLIRPNRRRRMPVRSAALRPYEGVFPVAMRRPLRSQPPEVRAYPVQLRLPVPRPGLFAART